MINSDLRKLALSGWFYENFNAEYCIPLKLQKFLFFYESFCKVKEENYDFKFLKGYRNGPVFSNVYGDYTKERKGFTEESTRAYKTNSGIINNNIAKKIGFLIKSLNEKDLSELTHKMNIWSAKKDRILNGEQQVDLDDSDFNNNDVSIINTLDSIYSDDIIDNNQIISINDKHFIINNNKVNDITEEQMDLLYEVANDKNLDNPVFIDIDDNGKLVID